MILNRAARGLVVHVFILCTCVLAKGGADRSDGARPDAGEWGEWSPWTSCSADCSTGITVRSRRCHPAHLLSVAALRSSADDTVLCTGKEKEIKLCNKQACQGGKKGWREEECAKYDSSVHSGRRYTWEPFTHPADPCKLTCRAKGYHFYSNLADQVVDGTPCAGATTNPTAVCLQGVCEEVGCDDVVGSTWRRDVCGVCQGDNSTCRTISGIFTRQDLEPGLNQIIIIPAGSTLINITGLRYTMNWLAVQDSKGDYFLNGGPNKLPAGDYEAVGTIFQYKTSQECTGQCILAQGPTDQEIKLMLNTHGRNHGVMYNFNIPAAVTDDYFQRIIGTTTSPTVTVTDTPYVPYMVPEGGDNSDEALSASTADASDDGTKETTTNPGIQTTDDTSEFLQSEENDSEDSYLYDSEEENDDNVKEPEEKSDERSGSSSVSIALSKLLVSNKRDEHSSHGMNHSDSSVEDLDLLDVNEGGLEEKEENDEEEEFSDEIAREDAKLPKLQIDDDDEDDEGVGAPEPMVITPQANKITRKERPRFVDPYDHAQDSLVGSAEKSEFNTATGGAPYQDNLESTDDVPGHHVDTTTSSSVESNQTETTMTPPSPMLKEQSEEQKNASSLLSEVAKPDGGETPTPVPGHSVRPQNDSPTRPQSESSIRPSLRKFRRPQFSQSFTYRRRHKARKSQSRDSVSDDRQSSPSHRLRPRPAPSGTSSQTPGGRKIRFKAAPRSHSSSGRRLIIGSLNAFEQSSSDVSPYDRIEDRSSAYSRRGPSIRQALTLGPSGSVDKDGTVTLANGNRRSTIGRQRGRWRGSRRSRTESSRQQQTEYERKQAEYRRKLERRRKQREQQRAARKAEYERRLEEHNRRVRQRQLEVQRRLQQRTESHNRRGQGRHRHNQRKPGRHHRHRQPESPRQTEDNGVPRPRIYDSRQQSTAIKPQLTTRPAPTEGIVPYGEAAEEQAPFGVRTTKTLTTRTTEPTKRNENQTWADGSTVTSQSTTQDFLTKPSELPATPVVPILIPDQATVAGNAVPPRFIPDDSEEDVRSSFDGLSNQLPTNGDDNRLIINSEGNVVPNVIDSGLRIGEGGSISSLGEDHSKQAYEWRVSGLTECTLSCGGGLQQTVVVCLDTRTQAVVTDGNCLHLPKPKTTAVTCNTRPCPAEWQSSQWASCSVSCGPGEQTRLVTCVTRISATLNLTMPDENCQSSSKPESRQACENAPCNAWRKGNWSDCSVNCGSGIRTRTVFCVDQTGFDVTDDQCPGSKPPQEESCDMGPCGKGWYYTRWPEQCPVGCGAGTMKRQVTCLGEGGYPLPASSCSSKSRPVAQQDCKSNSSCGGRWFTAEWGQCNVTCGRGSMERDVLCMKSLPGGILHMVGEENCNPATKPDRSKPCQLQHCSAQWYMTSWTKCSKSCGTGQRTRELKCLDSYQRPSLDCLRRDKPHAREACNTQGCVSRPSQVVDVDCKDTFSRCEVVRLARMCRFSYYKKKCCLTCSGDS